MLNTTILNSLTLAALVIAHNNLADHAERDEVTKFKNKTVGREAVVEIFEAANKARADGNLPLLALNEDGSLSNVETAAEGDETGSEVTGGETGSEVTGGETGSDAPVEKPAETQAAATAPAVVKTGKKPGKAPSISPTDIIILKVKENPKRSTAAARYANYKTGMLVSEYAAAIESSTQATRDILWDKNQNWIEVVGAKSARGKAARAELTAVKASDEETPEGEAEATDDATPEVDPATVQEPVAETGATA